MADSRGKRRGPVAAALPARAPMDAMGLLRIVLGLVAVFVAVLAVLALVNSFFLEPRAPGPRNTFPPTTASPGQETNTGTGTGGGGGGGSGWDCDDIVRFFLWTFIGLGVATVALLGVAYARRHKNKGEVLTGVWGVLALVGFFLSLIAAGLWRLMAMVCETSKCGAIVSGTFSVYTILLILTLTCCGMGIVIAHAKRKHFFRTGWGPIGFVLYLPTVIVGMFWFFIRYTCSLNLCPMEDVLSLMFWLSLLGGLACFVLGALVEAKLKLGFWASGWGVVGILLLVLAGFAGLAWFPIHEACSKQEPPECDKLMDQVASAFWVTLGISAVPIGASIAIWRRNLKKALGTPLAVLGYVGLGLAVLIGLGWLLLNSICHGKDRDLQPGETPGPTGPRPGDPGNPPAGGNEGENGVNMDADINFDPKALMWILIILGAIAAAIFAYYLFKNRGSLKRTGAPGPVPPTTEDVQATERKMLLDLLSRQDLRSRDAVVAAYRAFLAWAAERGHPKSTTDTPAEHARRVMDVYKLTPAVVSDLVSAYEVARLSPREPTAEERKRAVAASRDVGSPQERPKGGA